MSTAVVKAVNNGADFERSLTLKRFGITIPMEMGNGHAYWNKKIWQNFNKLN